MAKTVLVGILVLVAAAACQAAEFKDVPRDHWAAESISTLASEGIVKGYPDGTYKGSQTVTRYELAVALERMVAFIQDARKPLSQPPAKQQDQSGKNAQDPAQSLQANGFIPPDSPLLKDTTKPITTDQLADALASVSKRLIEINTPARADSTNDNSANE